MTAPFRLPEGGLVDRARPLRFEFDGRPYEGLAGDTLASALLANGVHFVARSFKYHRPRGIFSAGSEEPCAMVRLGRGARAEPNVRATTTELFDGLVAASQNCWPSLDVDVGAIAGAGALSRLFPAGFYYKTFMWPPSPKGWLRYERFVRAAAGTGVAPALPDPDRYEHRYAHCDVLVVGGGPAGLAAARSAAASGARVILCDEGPRFGGSLLGDDATVDGLEATAWADLVVRELAGRPDVTLLPRTTAFGVYDGLMIGLLERVADHLAAPPELAARQRLWKVRARAVVMATGAIERSVAYANNDLPGTMLAGAARIYVRRYAVRPGTRAVVFTTNDSAYAAAIALRDAGVAIAAVVDIRPEADLYGALPRRARELGLPIVAASAIVGAHGGKRVTAVDIAPAAGGSVRWLDCDLVCVSGGLGPAVHLYAQARGTLRYDDASAALAPQASPLPILAEGAAKGRFGLADALADGHAAGLAAAPRRGIGLLPPPRAAPVPSGAPAAVWSILPRWRDAKRFVDLQSDVTIDDVLLAAREGYASAEHAKRYTTLGMGADQGKTGNLLGLALLAEATGRTIAELGTTTHRPPYTPVTMGAFPGPHRGEHVLPARRSAMHDWHVEHGARMANVGLWKRPHSYPRPGESEDDAAAREARNVRTGVGLVDVSTLGKIELQGRDVVLLLNRIYVNRWDTLAVGRCRYGLMLREDGMVLDDGTTSRLGPTHYLTTTTTVNAVRVMQHVERLLQVDWPELEAYATPVTEQWAAAALSGPRARAVLARLVDIDVSNAAFPFLAVAECRLRGAEGPIPARVFRMSYSGELAYEIHVPANRGRAMWEAVLAAGAPDGIAPYGTEAMSTLRIEKGHVVIGPEADGRTTADDLGMGRLVSPAKWCVGKPLTDRPALRAPDRWQLVGLTALDGASMPRAAKLVADPDRAPPNPIEGHVTSSCRSPNLDAWIALALLANGRARHGETLWAVSPLANARARVEVGPPCFIDPDGERLRG